MDAPLMRIPAEEIQEAFFRAMVESSWASGAEALPSSERPRYKMVLWRNHPWLVVDEWCVGPNGLYSAGSVTVFYHSWPVWVMSFHGCYEKEAIPFLRQALMEAYEQRNFQYGRARPGYCTGPLIYSHRQSSGEFSRFRCQERITDTDQRRKLGYHVVQGMLLI
jgi:hypothetical protein